MEYRDQIVSKLSGKEIFLQNSLAEYEKPNIYSLETEFAKTKKNQDIKPYLIFFGFIFLLIVATLVTTNYLEVTSRQVNIDISDFQDLRLKETLSAAKEKEQELNRKTEELTVKAKELDSKTGELQNLKSSFGTEVQRAKEQIQEESDLKNADKKALQRLEKKEQKRIDDLKKQYEKQFAQKTAENDALKQHQKDQDDQMKQYKAVVEGYQYGLNYLLKEQKAIGCVMDPRQRKNISLYFIKNPKLSAETEIELYRTQGEYIGKLKLIPGETGLRAEVVEVASNQKIKPLDWFRLP